MGPRLIRRGKAGPTPLLTLVCGPIACNPPEAQNLVITPDDRGCPGPSSRDARDSFLDIVAQFLHLEVIIKKVGGKTVKKETMIFPRYHQLDCVRKLEADAPCVGPGTNYLIQQSGESGGPRAGGEVNLARDDL